MLKLAAFDAEDLQVISAHLQDAIIRVRDIHYSQRMRRLIVLANRFAWEAATASAAGEFQRRRSALIIDRVTAARSRRIAIGEPDGVLSLLALSFAEVDPPAGKLTLAFAGGGAIDLDVECVEARLDDVGAAWSTRSRPDHGA